MHVLGRENFPLPLLVLTVMSYVRMCIDSHMTRQLSGTKVDFLEPVKPLGKISLVGTLLTGFPIA